VNILAIETATQAVGCALWADDRPLGSFSLMAGRRHAETLLPAVDELCRRAGLGPADLGAVAVDVGPGLFTGLRVGLAAANAMAAALGVPVVGVTSLDALAYPQRRRPGLLAAIVDARRAEVYWALYRSEGHGGAPPSQLRAPALATPEMVADELVAIAGEAQRAERVLAVGDGAWRYRQLLAERQGLEVGGPADMWPSPLVVAELGCANLAAAGAAGPPRLQPVYLRQADVRIGWEQVGGRVSGEPPHQQAASPVNSQGG
jgi:tRNA threonylcarbamoyladenosine biosynthesis protein TsaB